MYATKEKKFSKESCNCLQRHNRVIQREDMTEEIMDKIFLLEENVFFSKVNTFCGSKYVINQKGNVCVKQILLVSYEGWRERENQIP